MITYEIQIKRTEDNEPLLPSIKVVKAVLPNGSSFKDRKDFAEATKYVIMTMYHSLNNEKEIIKYGKT